MTELDIAWRIGVAFAWVGGVGFIVIGVLLSVRAGRLHPLLLVCISAMAVSWIEAPYDWAMYAQFPPELPRMPSWWPLNMTWGGGLPSAVPPGYVAYFTLPAVFGAWLGRGLSRQLRWRLPQSLLIAGFAVGCVWAFCFNALFGPRFGVFYYGYVIEGLALWEGTRYQYPLYDTVAMGIQMMVFAYLLGRSDAHGRTFIDVWADSFTASRLKSSLLSVVAVIVIGHAIYLAVFAPHLATKLMGLVDVGTGVQLFEGVPNQPL